MVRAYLEGRKTQTGQVILASNSTVCGYNVTSEQSVWKGLAWDKPIHKDKGPHMLHPSESGYLHVPFVDPIEGDNGRVFRVRCRYDIGDRLWVKEMLEHSNRGTPTRYAADGCPVMRDGESIDWPFRKSPLPAIFMPRWASRINLEIVGLRPERLQEITEEDAKAEGIERHEDSGHNIFWFEVAGQYHGNIQDVTAIKSYAKLWDSINTKRGYSWESNPWVWVITFPRYGK